MLLKPLWKSGKWRFLCETKKEFLNLVQIVEATKGHNIILQEFVKDSKGRDLVFTVGRSVIGCVERVASENEFKANSLRGAVKPHELLQK